ncbi:MAG: MOSC domain-containing protein [Planctomycetota bacterium]
MARVIAVCISSKKGVRKRSVPSGTLLADYGLEGDAHAGMPRRQVSLLASESIAVMKAKGADVEDGSFGENLVTEGIVLPSLPIGTRLRIGPDALVEVTQIGKECHDHCEIYKQVGDCIMPREGIFVRVLKSGTVQPGGEIEKVTVAGNGTESGSGEKDL